MRFTIVLFTIICIIFMVNADIPAQEIREVGYYDTPGFSFNLFVLGDYAYMADANGGLRIIDISNARRPEEIGHFETTNAYDIFVREVSDVEKYAYLVEADEEELIVIDVYFPDTPNRIGTCNFQRGPNVFVSGDYAYVLGFNTINITNPSNPVLVGNCNVGGRDIVISGNYAYVAQGRSGLQVVDVSDPRNPNGVGGQRTEDANGVSIVEDYAYVADVRSGLIIFDISDPDNPDEIGSCETPGESQAVSVSGNFAYVADEDEGLRVIDISDPANPVEVDHCNTPGQAYGVFIMGYYAYIAYMDRGLRIIDVSYYINFDVAPQDLKPELFQLPVAYPNPFNSSINISYQIPVPSPVLLSIFDLSGRVVATLVDGEHFAGYFTTTWNGQALASGLYLVKMQSPELNFTQKIMLVR